MAAVGPDPDALVLEPFRHQLRIAHGQRVDDSVTGKDGELFGEPGQPLRLPGQAYGLQRERRTRQGTTLNLQITSEYVAQVLHHPIVRGGGCSEQSHVAREISGRPLDSLIVRPKIVPPVGNAVTLVDHEEGDAVGDSREDLGSKMLVGESFRRDKEDVHFVAVQRRFHFRPVVPVGRRDHRCTDTHPFRGLNLVAHQRQQGRHEQGRTSSPFP